MHVYLQYLGVFFLLIFHWKICKCTAKYYYCTRDINLQPYFGDFTFQARPRFPCPPPLPRLLSCWIYRTFAGTSKFYTFSADPVTLPKLQDAGVSIDQLSIQVTRLHRCFIVKGFSLGRACFEFNYILI